MSHKVRIKHGAFWYYRNELAVGQDGKEVERLIPAVANQSEEVELDLQSDYDRGVKHDAFLADDERIDPATGEVVSSNSDVVAPEEEGGEVSLADLDHSELVDWLLSTGEFDGEKKPTAQEVVDAVGNDSELGERVLEAEKEASGANPRKDIVKAFGDDE